MKILILTRGKERLHIQAVIDKLTDQHQVGFILGNDLKYNFKQLFVRLNQGIEHSNN